MDNILCLVGPTASGKTELAVKLAQALDGEVVSCDSMQLYKRMDIGTAKPTRDEMCGIPHHMIDVLDPNEDFSVGRYVQMADAIVQDILRRGKTVVVTGGTGLYCDSLMLGRTFAPYPSTGVREELERLDTAVLLARLQAVDPDSAERLHPSDRKRIVRAMEIYLETGKTVTAHNAETQLQPPKYHPIWLGITYENRADLYARIDLRVQKMLQAGLVEEVQALLESGVRKDATSMQAIGYKELTAYFSGESTLEEALELIAKRSRNYAKRQLTWFRRNEQIHWLVRRGEEEISPIFSAARQYIPFFAQT